MSLPATIAPGVYRLQYNLDCGQQFVDIIINGRDQEISFILNGIREFPVIVESEENKAWSSYLRQNRTQVSKLEFLYNFLSFYPASEDEVAQRVTEAVSLERNKYYTNFDKFVKNNKGSWAEKIVSNQPYYFSDPTVVSTRRDFVRHDYYWDGINTNNPELLNSPLYSTLIDNYIDFHSTGDYTESELECYFNRSVAVIMEKFSHNVSMKFFATDYLKEKRSQMIKN